MSIENTEITLREFREFIDGAEVNSFKDLKSASRWALAHQGGYQSVPRPEDNPEHFNDMLEAAELINDVRSGRLRKWVLEEAFTTSDFTILTTNILQWRLIQEYQTFPTIYDAIFDVNTAIPDFRQIKETNLDGLDTPMNVVEEQGEYLSTGLTERTYQYNVQKYGRAFGVSWETIVNDFLRVFDRMPGRLASAARNTENKFVTGLFASSTGPNSTIYTSGHSNLHATGATSVLQFSSLSDAYNAMQVQTSATGSPILARPKTLVVPPQLELTALQITRSGILLATQIQTASPNLQTGNINPLSTLDLQVVVNPWLPIIDTTHGTTAWYLFADKQYGTSGEVGFLSGHSEPELTQRMSNHIYVNGGGIVPPQNGDFESDSIRWRIRHILGGVMTDYRFTYASQGA